MINIDTLEITPKELQRRLRQTNLVINRYLLAFEDYFLRISLLNRIKIVLLASIFSSRDSEERLHLKTHVTSLLNTRAFFFKKRKKKWKRYRIKRML